ncbi:hypothetical protein KQI68_02820 [Peptoniphilus sp. MSJ-1]|uniref:Uncharacterized protein n=1 Tax=Peptoniphilus ovalis TaxID=2841503 RepID=A0ABS6FF07_9FIRM|nr:hypothetical protein [Peptoniphilus ovalis]MBU5668766.1 hypothetical protein [Peptoniphilus ovalis]
MQILWLIICIVVVVAIMARSKTLKNKPEENIVNKSKDDPVVMNLHKDINSVTTEDKSDVKEEKKKEYNNSRKKNRGKKRRERKLDNVDLDIDKENLHEDPVEIEKSEDIEPTDLQKSNLKTSADTKEEKEEVKSKDKVEDNIEDVELDIDRDDLHEDPVEIQKSEDIEPTNLQKSNLKTSTNTKEEKEEVKSKDKVENNIEDVDLDIDRSDLHEDPVEIQKSEDIEPTDLQKSNLLTSAGALEGANAKPKKETKSKRKSMSEDKVEEVKTENIEDVKLDIDRDDLHEDPVETQKSENIEPTDLQKSNLETSRDNKTKSSDELSEADVLPKEEKSREIETSEEKVSKDFKSSGKYPIIFEAMERQELSLEKIVIKSENTKDKKWKELYPKNEEDSLNFSINKIKENLNNSSLSEFLNNTSENPAVLKKKDTESYEFTSSDAKDIENILNRYGLDLNSDEVSKITSKIKVDKNNIAICEITDIISTGNFRYHFENKF